MDRRYEIYCLADPLFYDLPTRAYGPERDYARARQRVPDGWDRHELDDWLVYRPRGVTLPSQGWKIHASGCLDNAEAIVDAVWDYCVPRRIAFKFVRNEPLLMMRNSKAADRGASGKLVTIYPLNDAHLETILTELGATLEGQAGPYILSDLRWGSGPLYVRYGGFTLRYFLGPSGEREAGIEDDQGQLVPDRREPTFSVPAWVTLPECLEPHLAARSSATVQQVPYRFERALHFSNGGGIYQGVDLRTNEPVVLKEARPHAGLAGDRSDAVQRLEGERDVLARLSGSGVAPEPRDFFRLGDHAFLVQELIEGDTLSGQFVLRYPLITARRDPDTLAEYVTWALEACRKAEAATRVVHQRGIVIGDLHPSNMLVRENDDLVLVDWEVAGEVDAPRRAALGMAGFVSPPGCSGAEIDRYALACLRLHLFMPLTTLIRLNPEKVDDLAAAIQEQLPVPSEFLVEAVTFIRAAEGIPPRASTNETERRLELTPNAEDWPARRDSLARAILASATPDREDRLFPGDIDQFVDGGGLGFAHGAAGVLYALDTVGAARTPEHEEWLVRGAARAPRGSPRGFYDGLHGVADVLERLGRRADALNLLDRCLDRRGGWDQAPLDLLSGLAGMGLNLAHFARVTGDSSFQDAAFAAATALADRLGDEQSVADVSGDEQPYAGLLRGSSGAALLFVHLFEQTADQAWLDLAATALRQDLRRCVEVADGTLQVNEGWRTMPYLCDGSVGIGMVLGDYLRHRQNEHFAAATRAIRAVAEAPFCVQPGLFYGRAGMLLALSRGFPPGAAAADPTVASQIRSLNWYALRYRGDLAFPGDQLLRLSMDLASGSAGVLLALGAALHENAVHLPFLGAPGSSPVAE